MKGVLQKVASCDGGSSSKSPFEFTDAAVDDGEHENFDGWVLEKINFDVGNHKEEEEEYHKDTRTLPDVSNGWISVIGRRRVMEDAVAVVEIDSSYHFFGVYDGHGGSDVANACRDQLHHRVEARIRGYDGGTVDWSKVMSYCFLKMDEEVGSICDGGSGGVEIIHDVGRAMCLKTMGSTAMVVLVGKEAIVVANCGDSRTVLCRTDSVAVPLSRDHKPDVPDERERVEAAGGRVINWDGYRVLGILDTSRSIGDHYLKPLVISEPEVSVYERNDSDAFLVIASDGLWDFMSNDFACEVVLSCLDGQIGTMFSNDGFAGNTASEAAALLAELAMARGSKDNISVIVVDLKKQIC
ncbi:protein phosphatase 2C 51-like [Humulus lupulus]|uniref:protein phosphatase 2C 51-like n=1 Tax=Humulus lupulus TaxID=3486 RepID=UPI002B400CF5|nr:protein phosphatase 2C 51-like [Humulus lupulus]